MDLVTLFFVGFFTGFLVSKIFNVYSYPSRRGYQAGSSMDKRLLGRNVNVPKPENMKIPKPAAPPPPRRPAPANRFTKPGEVL